ncbi:MAG: helix-turn-helix domain-containing protein [Polyangiaceae bacterium]
MLQGFKLAGLDQFLNVREVAALLGVSTASVYGLCTAGALPHARVANAIRIPASALAKLMKR